WLRHAKLPARTQRCLRKTRKTCRRSRRRRSGRSQRCRRDRVPQPRRLDVYLVLREGPGNQLDFRRQVRHRSLRTLLSRDARERNLSAAVAVRSRVSWRGTHRERCAADDRGSEAGVRDGGGVERAAVGEIDDVFNSYEKQTLLGVARPHHATISLPNISHRYPTGTRTGNHVAFLVLTIERSIDMPNAIR